MLLHKKTCYCCLLINLLKIVVVLLTTFLASISTGRTILFVDFQGNLEQVGLPLLAGFAGDADLLFALEKLA